MLQKTTATVRFNEDKDWQTVSVRCYNKVYKPDPSVSLNHLTRAGMNPKIRVKNNKPTRAAILIWSRYSIVYHEMSF